ncbi:MAG: alpha amylase [Lachnospiraceae bacterium]|nr:alpha amylase [Lachnospiraceae bacterium]
MSGIRKTKIICVLMALTILLAGCSRNDNGLTSATGTDSQIGSGTAIAQDITDSADTPDQSAEAKPVSALNVIDDKYRNYYEVFVYSFCDSDGDGIGDLKGVDEKLGYIKDLGCNGIWLMPVMSSPTYHKYDVTDYMAIDPEYGTMEDFEKLIADAHEHDINVIIDFVMNHTSSKHEWFVKACDYLKGLDPSDTRSLEELVVECPYVGYYHFSREKEKETYYEVDGTPFYYEGEFWSEMPDLNYASEELWSEFESIIPFWVEKGVDGFRMDATMHFKEGDTGFNTSVMKRAYECAQKYNPDFYMVSEVWAGESTIASYYDSKTDSLFNFDAAGSEGVLIGAARGNVKASRLVSSMKKYEDDFGAVYPDYIDAAFLTNHDMGRVSNTLNGDEKAIKFAGGLLGTMSGSVFVYYGEEIGMKSQGTKDENKRLPMPWGDDNGICKGPADADKGITSDFGSVADQISDDDSILNYYRHVMRIRNTYPEIARGHITIVDEATKDNKAVIIKAHNNEKIAVLINNSKRDSVDITQSDITLINEHLCNDTASIVDQLTVDGSTITYDDAGFAMPPRSIAYVK